jgi:tetratricopeptide (TPR) repeat protein
MALLSEGCRERQAARGSVAPGSPGDEARMLIDQGQLDLALERLAGLEQTPDVLYLEGLAWSRKARLLPPPPPAPLPRGASPAPPALSDAEKQAVSFLERAIAARAEFAAAHRALADLLAPYAARASEAERDAAARRRGGKPPASTLPAASGVDASPARVIAEYRKAAEADPRDKTAVDALIAFSDQVGDFEAAAAAFELLVSRDRESADPYVHYGDFLLGRKKAPEEAIQQYRQALIWRPDDATVKTKIARIYLEQAVAAFDGRQYATTQTRLDEARKWVAPSSAESAQVLVYQGRLSAIRGGR